MTSLSWFLYCFTNSTAGAVLKGAGHLSHGRRVGIGRKCSMSATRIKKVLVVIVIGILSLVSSRTISTSSLTFAGFEVTTFFLELFIFLLFKHSV